MDPVEELRKAIEDGDLDRAGTLIGPVWHEREGLRRIVGERDALRVELEEAQAERDHEARCRIRRREERDIARADRATLLEAIATFEGALFAAGGASAVALFGTASKIRERTTDA